MSFLVQRSGASALKRKQIMSRAISSSKRRVANRPGVQSQSMIGVTRESSSGSKDFHAARHTFSGGPVRDTLSAFRHHSSALSSSLAVARW
jgi:hypothetical protein